MSKKRNFPGVKRPYVFTPMCLDFLHHGHVNILKNAAKYGSIILGLITDKGIKGYKKKKPINNFKKRKSIALLLKDVKYIIPVTSLQRYVPLARKYNFDYIVHGDDWKNGPQAAFRKKLKGIVSEWKGKVIDVPYTKKISSTIIKRKIKRKK